MARDVHIEGMKIRLGQGIIEILCLDDRATREEIGVDYMEAGRRHVYVTGSREALARLASCLRARLGPGWDQPAWYVRSANVNAQAIEAALARELHQ